MHDSCWSTPRVTVCIAGHPLVLPLVLRRPLGAAATGGSHSKAPHTIVYLWRFRRKWGSVWHTLGRRCASRHGDRTEISFARRAFIIRPQCDGGVIAGCVMAVGFGMCTVSILTKATFPPRPPPSANIVGVAIRPSFPHRHTPSPCQAARSNVGVSWL